MAIHTATPAATFLDTIGVNIHLGHDATGGQAGNAYANVPAVINALAYLGVKNVRDRFDYDYVMAAIDTVAAAGVKFCVNMGTGPDVVFNSEIARIRARSTVVRYVEGPNEVDNWPAMFGGDTGYDAAIAEMAALYAAMNAVPSTMNIPVLNLSLGNPVANWTNIGDQSANTDLGTAHFYPPADNPAGEHFLTSTYWLVQQNMTPGVPMVITEGGYSSWPMASPNGSVPEGAHATLTLNYIMEAFQAGVPATYLYELTDQWADPGGTDRERHFGLFRYDWTPKPAATALRNFTSVLATAGTAAAGATLDYTVSGMPTRGNDTLLSGADGKFFIVLWNDARLYDFANSVAVTVAPVATTLSFAAPRVSVKIYDPLAGAVPVQSFSNTASVPVSLPDHPVIVEVSNSLVEAYTRGIEAVASGVINLGAVTVKAMLTTVSYAHNKAIHQFRSQVTNEAATGAGYASGGINVSATVSRDETNNRVELTLGSAAWTAPSGQTLANVRKAVYYVSTGNAASDRLLAVSDFGANYSATNQTLSVTSVVVRFQN